MPSKASPSPAQMSKQQILEALIEPWQIGFDEKYQKNYYYNPLTEESVWELPPELQQRIKLFWQEYEKELQSSSSQRLAQKLDPATDQAALQPHS